MSTEVIRTATYEPTGVVYEFRHNNSGTTSNVSVFADDVLVTKIRSTFVDAAANRLETRDYEFANDVSAYKGQIWEHHYPVLFATEILPQDADYPRGW